MKKIVIFGNSGSGKSTLAKSLCNIEKLSHLDLDTLAWQATSPPERKPLQQSEAELLNFIDSHSGWVIEGCYADILTLALPHCSEIIFMNLPIEACIRNAKNRPWEPHKYVSQQAQDANLPMLIHWISQYTERNDTFSYQAHHTLYEQFSGTKRIIKTNEPYQ